MEGISPPGLSTLPSVIDWKQESQLIQEIDKHTWETSIGRRVQHYGYRYNYFARKVESKTKSRVPELPRWSIKLCQQFLDKKWIPSLPNQLIINEYLTGQGITKHTDHPMFGGVIFSISLGSPCTMIFRREEQVYSIVVSSRMFMKLEGEVRSSWTHEISPLTEKNARRLSLTFRYVDDSQFSK